MALYPHFVGVLFASCSIYSYICITKGKKNDHIKVDRDTHQNFYEMPRKAFIPMAGPNRKVFIS